MLEPSRQPRMLITRKYINILASEEYGSVVADVESLLPSFSFFPIWSQVRYKVHKGMFKEEKWAVNKGEQHCFCPQQVRNSVFQFSLSKDIQQAIRAAFLSPGASCHHAPRPTPRPDGQMRKAPGLSAKGLPV